MVTGLAEHSGKIKGLARNAVSSRRFGGTLDTGVAAIWTYREKPNAPLVQLESAEIRKEFLAIRQSMLKMTCSAYIIELLDHITPEHQPAPELFKLLANALSWMDEVSEEKAQLGAARFAAICLGKVLQISGTQPNLSDCQICKKSLFVQSEATVFSPTSDYSGVFCSNCRPARGDSDEIRQPILKDLWVSLGLPIRKAMESEQGTDTSFSTLFHWIERYAFHQVPGLSDSAFRSRPLFHAQLIEAKRVAIKSTERQPPSR